MGSEYTHVIINLFAIIALMFVLVFVLKKIKLSKYVGNKHINIINVVPIGPKERIILMEVNNLFLLVGATPTHIEKLHVFDHLDLTKSKQLDQKKNFSELMTKLKTKATKSESVTRKGYSAAHEMLDKST